MREQLRRSTSGPFRRSTPGPLLVDRLISIDEAAAPTGRGRRTVDRWIANGLPRPYKRPRDPRTLIDLAELPEAMRRAGRPGPKPKRER